MQMMIHLIRTQFIAIPKYNQAASSCILLYMMISIPISLFMNVSFELANLNIGNVCYKYFFNNRGCFKFRVGVYAALEICVFNETCEYDY